MNSNKIRFVNESRKTVFKWINNQWPLAHIIGIHFIAIWKINYIWTSFQLSHTDLLYLHNCTNTPIYLYLNLIFRTECYLMLQYVNFSLIYSNSHTCNFMPRFSSELSLELLKYKSQLPYKSKKTSIIRRKQFNFHKCCD